MTSYGFIKEQRIHLPQPQRWETSDVLATRLDPS